MEIPGWAYLIVGVIVSGYSGYVYYYIPKSTGEQNMSMALFFFIGIIFIVVGVEKILSRKIEKKHEEIEIHNMRIKKHEEIEKENRPNKIEEEFKKQIQQEQKPIQQTAQHHTSEHPKHPEHSNRWYNTHPYQGPHQQTHQQQYTIVQCAKCSAKNHSTSNFCHVCGTKLK